MDGDALVAASDVLMSVVGGVEGGVVVPSAKELRRMP